jgi:hypothetical protein
VPFVSDTATSTASRPAFVTIAIRPSEGWDGGINKAVSTRRRSKKFSQTGLDNGIVKEPVGQIKGVDGPKNYGKLSDST